MEIKFKKAHKNAQVPKRGTRHSAGYDLTAVSIDLHNDIVTYDTGIIPEIHDGYFGLACPRSSIYQKDLVMVNAPGVIDSDYRGTIKFKFRILGSNLYKIGDRIGQLIIQKYEEVDWIESEELTDTHRGEGGYGSTGI